MSNDIIFQSTYENINRFIEGKPIDELVNLYMYVMGSESMDRPPSDMEKDFIEEFFTFDAWAMFINSRKQEREVRKSYFKHIPPFDLHTISGILSFEIMKRIEGNFKELVNLKKYKANKQQERRDLKKELKGAISNSYEGEVFYKVEGWCNISEVLEKHNLISLEDGD